MVKLGFNLVFVHSWARDFHRPFVRFDSHFGRSAHCGYLIAALVKTHVVQQVIERDELAGRLRALARLGAPAALVHSDVGSGDEAANRALAAALGPALDRLMAPGGIVVSDQEFRVPGWRQVELPAGVVHTIGFVVAADRLERPLTRLRIWLERENAVIMGMVLLVLGVVVLARGIAYF